MADIIQNSLYFSALELTKNNIVKEQYLIKRALPSQRNNTVNCWSHKRFSYVDGIYVEHPLTSRKGSIYIEFDNLRSNYKELIKAKLCNNIDPYLYVENNKMSLRKKELDSFNQSLSEYLEIDPSHVIYFTNTKNFSPADCQRLARGAAWLSLLNSINAKESHLKGYRSVSDLRNAALEVINQELRASLVRFKGTKLNSLQVLFRYMKAFNQDGCKCLVTEKSGNNNAQKITSEISAWLITEMSKENKPSREDVAEAYNLSVDKTGWQKITTSAIKQHLNKPEIMRVWYYNRHGKQAGDNYLQTFAQRRKAPFADAVWDLDGTALQLYYRDEKGQKLLSNLYVYYVIDEYSTSIVGYSVAFTETSQMVTEALQMAVRNHGYKPYQLRYDNGSANVSGAVKNLMSSMSRVNFPCQPYKGRSKIIETLQGHIEQRILRKLANFKGGSPTARGLDSKANPDFLKEIKKHLPSQMEVIEQLKEAVNDWNNRAEERDNYGIMQGETKAQRYTHKHEKRVKLNYFEQISLFMIERPGLHTYRNQGIRIQIDRNLYNYIVPDEDGIGDFIFQQTNLGKKFTLRVNPENTSLALLYDKDKLVAEAFEKEKYAACVADMKDGEAAKIRMFQLKQETYGQEYAKTELEKQRLILEAENIKATGTDGFSWQDLTKNDWNKTESLQVDKINGIESDFDKKLNEIGS